MKYTPLTPERAKALAMQWKRAAPLLEEQRERDIRSAETVESVACLAGMMEIANRDLPPRRSSGMVEMQRYFMTAREAANGAA